MALAKRVHPRVFIIQNQMVWSQEVGRFVQKYNTASAAKYGEPVFLLGPTAAPFYSEGVVKELQDKLQDFHDNDYLLLIGNPCLIGFAVAIAAFANNGKVKLLQWSGKQKNYIPVEANLKGTRNGD